MFMLCVTPLAIITTMFLSITLWKNKGTLSQRQWINALRDEHQVGCRAQHCVRLWDMNICVATVITVNYLTVNKKLLSGLLKLGVLKQ